jgi:hypothetical protein
LWPFSSQQRIDNKRLQVTTVDYTQKTGEGLEGWCQIKIPSEISRCDVMQIFWISAPTTGSLVDMHTALSWSRTEKKRQYSRDNGGDQSATPVDGVDYVLEGAGSTGMEQWGGFSSSIATWNYAEGVVKQLFGK